MYNFLRKQELLTIREQFVEKGFGYNFNVLQSHPIAP